MWSYSMDMHMGLPVGMQKKHISGPYMISGRGCAMQTMSAGKQPLPVY